MTDTINNEKRIRKYFLKTLADPVLLYTVLGMMSIMYHYRSSLAFAYGAAAYVIGWLVFRIFDYVNKHHFIGFLICIILYIFFGYAASYAMKRGEEGYSISWGLWFFTPQDALKYNKWYTIAVFILFLIFMLSVIYYFTRVRYRIFMNFLVFIIPFTIYGKEYEKMPIGYIIALAVGYVLMMVMFRQINENEKIRVVNRSEAWKSIAVFAVLFALCSTLSPKPTVQEDRQYLEMLIDADQFTDKLVKMIERFRDTSSGEQFRGNLSDRPTYYMEGGEPMRLKTATFSLYDYSKDAWNISDADSHYDEYSQLPIEFYDGRCIAEAVLAAAELDSVFAERYGLSEYVGTKFTFPELQKATLHSVTQGETIPIPQGIRTLTRSSYSNTFDLTHSDALLTNSDQYYGYDQFVFEYMPEGFFLDEDNFKAVVAVGNVSDYEQMLSDAYDILNDAAEEEYAETVLKSYLYYDTYTSDLLDYGNIPSIRRLAEEITAGCETDYEKAKAIEWYFLQSGFVYDLDYQKATGENVEDFLFTTKRGVCWEYATAMTLLSRAAGIPSRFCEGYLMHNEWEGSDNYDRNRVWHGYSISPRDGHAFPELYIKGYGWVTFEPTMSNVANEESAAKEKETTTHMLSKAGIIMLAAAAAALLLLIIMPTLTHKLFMLINNKRKPDKAVAGVMHRLCRVYGIAKVNTADEAAAKIKAVSGADISAAAELFNSSSYGGAEMSENDRTKAMEDYKAAYDAFREAKKKNRKRGK